MPKINNLKEENICFGSEFQKIQSMVAKILHFGLLIA
jgi:hypothetical protein